MSYSNKKYRIYPHFQDGRFFNHTGEKKPAFFLPTINMLIEWYLCKNYERKVDTSDWIEKATPIIRSNNLAITWVGHSTFLIQIGNINILTDPIFGNLSPLFPRILPAGINIENLPPIDFVILSHNHRDHMDRFSLKNLRHHHNTRFLVPIGDKAWFDRKGFKYTIENMWWDKISFTCQNNNIKTDIEFTFLPAFHWSQRGIFDYNKSLWGSWMISCNGINMYFAGDTAYANHFKAIAQEFSNIDIAFMPIGPCEPNLWMRPSHVNAEEAGQAFIDLKAKHFIPMHWGTYFFGIDNFYLPYNRIMDWWKQQEFKLDQQIHILKAGQRKNIIVHPDAIQQPYESPEIHLTDLTS